MQVHDALQRRDHLALGDGSEIDLHKYLSVASSRGGCAVLEAKTVAGLKKSVRWIRENPPEL